MGTKPQTTTKQKKPRKNKQQTHKQEQRVTNAQENETSLQSAGAQSKSMLERVTPLARETAFKAAFQALAISGGIVEHTPEGFLINKIAFKALPKYLQDALHRHLNDDGTLIIDHLAAHLALKFAK